MAPEIPVEIPGGNSGTSQGDDIMPSVGEDFAEVMARSQGLTVDVVGKSFGLTSNRQNIIADRKFDELDIEQSVANRYATTGKPSSGE